MPLARHDKPSIRKQLEHVGFLLTCLLRGMTALTQTQYDELEFLLTCLLRGMTRVAYVFEVADGVSTHMPLARHDYVAPSVALQIKVSTHMPLARHDG